MAKRRAVAKSAFGKQPAPDPKKPKRHAFVPFKAADHQHRDFRGQKGGLRV